MTKKSYFNQCARSWKVCVFATPMVLSANVMANAFSSSLSQDLQESPLSISLNSSQQYRVGAQQHQVVVTQYGILNKATVNQINEASNQAHVVQFGSNNYAELFQFGSQNVVNLSQQGNNNYAEILQQGDANIANISQAGEQTFKVQQIGNGLEVNVTFHKQ